MLSIILKSAWRQLWRNKIYSTINVLGLTIGLTAALLSGLWVHQQYQYDRFHVNRARVFQAMQDYAPGTDIETDNAVPMPLAQVLREETPGVKRVALVDWGDQHALIVGERRLRKYGYFVQPDFLGIFSFPLLQGKLADALAAPNQIVLTEATAQALFGDADPLGQTVSLDQEVNLQVSGVIANIPSTSTWQFDYLLPFSLMEQRQPWILDDADNWGSYSYQAFFELEEETTIESVLALHRGVYKAHAPESSSMFNVHALTDWHLYNVFEQGEAIGGRIGYVRLFSLIGILILLIACINFINLATARAAQRSKEIGVRKTIGAGRMTLSTQFFGEASLTILLALLLAIGVVGILLPYFNVLVAEQIQFPSLQVWFWGSIAGLWVISALLAGSLPAWYLSRFSPKEALQQNYQQSKTQIWTRRSLVATQFMIAIALIAGSLTVYQQVRHGQAFDPGYTAERLIAIPATNGIRKSYSTLKTLLIQSGAATEVSTASTPITEVSSTSDDISWPGQLPGQKLDMAAIAVGADYFTTLNIDMLEGRTFQPQAGADTAAVILNQVAITKMGLTNPLSTIVYWGDEPLRIIGIADNVIMENPFEPVRATFYIKRPWQSEVMIRLADNRPEDVALAKIAQIVEAQDPSAPFDYRFVADSYANKFKEANFMGVIVLVFAGLAVFLAALGLVGLALYLTERRAKEISIRKILGASVRQLWLLLSQEFMLLVLIGGLVAVPVGSYILQSWLEGFTYRIDFPWTVFVWAIMLVLFIAILTISGQSLRAALANPATRLRDE